MTRPKRGPMAASVLGLAAAGLLGQAAAAQQTIPVTIAAGHPPLTTGVAYLRDFLIPEIDRRLAETGNYRIDWTQAYAGSLVGVREVLGATGMGVTDMGYVPHLFMSDELPMEQFTYVMPFGTGDTQLLMEIVSEMHARIPAMTEAWESHNQILLAPVGIDDYHFVLTRPIEEVGDLSGRRLGLAGQASNWVRGTGVTPVALSLPDFYNSMQTGLIDGIITFESAITSYNFHEVAPYVATISFGAMYSSGLTANTDFWNGLPDEVRDVIAEVAEEYRDRVGAAYRDSGARAMAQAVEEGATIIEISDEARRDFAMQLPAIARDWAEELDARGMPGTEIMETYIALLRERGVEVVRDWSAD